MKLALHWKILIGLILGTITGLLVNYLWTPELWRSLGVGDPAAYMANQPSEANAAAGYIALAARFLAELTDFAGKLFLRCLRFIAVPIVLFSLIVAVANLGDPRKLGRVGGKTIAIFLFTGFTSAALGVTIATIFQPGVGLSTSIRESLPGADAQAAAKAAETAHTISGWQMALDAVPLNPFAAIANAQMLQVVALSIIIGMGLTLIPTEKSRPVIAFCDGIAEAVLKLVQLLMHAAPYAVFALMVTIISSFGLSIFVGLVKYSLVVIAGLATILFILYPTLTTLLTPRGNKVGWARFFRAISPAQLVAFSSSSSAATFPVTLECARDRLGADEDIASFVCSLGISFNMDGTALYQAVVVTFLAQLYGVDLSFADRLFVTILAASLSIGVPGIPGGSLVVMAVVLDYIKVPTEGIAIILAVDRILDMCRTIVNVSGDAMGTAIIAASEGKLKTPQQLAMLPEA
ncbi:MAG: dicarboxylate/amino acid:cation symporter [Phycisphaerales bacterium]|nr:dicarboxylate/amino acid:cation symporter [Phycisphaerales bacterium]